MIDELYFRHFVMVADRPDLLALALASIEGSALWPNTLIFDNSIDGWVGKSRDWPVPVERPAVPLSWAQSMNYFNRCALCPPISHFADTNPLSSLRSTWPSPRFIRGKDPFDFWSYQHADAQVQPGTVDKFLAKIDDAIRLRDRWCTVFTHYDWLSAYNPAAVDEIGGWDWLFPDPNYNCDQDFFHRARKKGFALLESGADITHLDGGSTTIRANPLRFKINGLKTTMNAAYYRAKWGGPPGAEIFEKPWVGRVSAEQSSS